MYFDLPYSWRSAWSNSSDYPTLSYSEEDNETVITMYAPGLDRDGLSVSIEEEGDRELLFIKYESEKKKGKPIIYNNFTHYECMQKKWDSDNIKATYEDGVLEVVIPHHKAKTKKEIPISYGKD